MPSSAASRSPRSRSRSRSRKRGRRDRDDFGSNRKSSKRKKSKRSSRSRSRSRTSHGGSNVPIIRCSTPLRADTSLNYPISLQSELVGSRRSFDSTNLGKDGLEFLEAKIQSQVTERLGNIEDLVRDKVLLAKNDMEVRIRAQVEQELQSEIEAIKKREKESRERCSAMERELEQKKRKLVESESKLQEERLAMLDARHKYDQERLELQKEKDEMRKSDQQSILNKGGTVRQPIKLKFGK